MARTTSAKSERGHRARRWCSRALFAFGGAVAGTAAAWAFSAGAAGAAQADEWSWSTESRPVADVAIDSIKHTASDATAQVRDEAGRITDTLHTGDESGPAEDTRDDGAVDDSDGTGSTNDQVAERAESAADTATGAFDSCVGSFVGVLEELEGSPEDPFESNPEEWRERLDDLFSPGQLPESPIDGPDLLPAPIERPTTPGVDAPGMTTDTIDTADIAEGALIGVIDSGTSSRGTPVVDPLAAPVVPGGGIPMPLPAGAPSVPSAPGSGSAGAGHADGSPLGTTLGSDRALDALLAALVRSGVHAAPMQLGRQPGVTPD